MSPVIFRDTLPFARSRLQIIGRFTDLRVGAQNGSPNDQPSDKLSYIHLYT
jgi:hypothetical protein